MTAASTAAAAEPAVGGSGPVVLICPLCGASVDGWAPGPGGRPDAQCGECGSLERHRFLGMLLRACRPPLNERVLLDVATIAMVTDMIRELAPRRHVRIDLDPKSGSRKVDVQGSLTGLPFGDGTIDVLVCYHVLEHIPDDAAAIREIARVLSPTGLAYLQVPYRASQLTEEDPGADRETRIRRFGQHDHVRLYGHDFEDRLRAGGLRLFRLSPVDVLGPALCTMFGILPHEHVWLATRADAPDAQLSTDALRRDALEGLVRTLAGHRAESAREAANLGREAAELRTSLARTKRSLAAARRKAAAPPAPPPWRQQVTAALPPAARTALRRGLRGLRAAAAGRRSARR
jgi:SAM-dependent methyltransferase